MVLEDYTLKHVWGPKTQQAYPFEGSRQDSDPDQGSRRNLHISGAQCPERFSQRQKKPDPGQALRPFLRNCLFSNRSQGRDGADKLRPASIMRPQSNLIQFMRPYYDWIFGR